MANILLRNLHSLVQKRLLATSSLTSPLSSSFTAEYLVKSFGLPLEFALPISKKLRIDKKQVQKLDFLLNFLKSHGFDDTQIAKSITKRPGILQYQVNDILKPKFDLLIENGFVGQHLPELIVINPVILTRSLDSHIKPAIEFLKTLLTTNEVFVALRRSSWLLNIDTKGTIQPNIALLLSEGIPVDIIRKMLMMHPRTIMQNVDKVAYAVKTVKNLGFHPTSPMFVRALRVMVSMKESTWKSKVEVFKSFGWSENDVLLAFTRQPLCLACSELKIRRTMDFYLNTVKLEPEIIISYPKLLMYGFEKTVLPRYNVLKILLSKGLIKRSKKLAWMMSQSERRFMALYVVKHLDEVPNLLEIYHGSVEQKTDIQSPPYASRNSKAYLDEIVN